MLRNKFTSQAETQLILTEILAEMESLLIELSELLPTHPEPNRFAHAILEIIHHLTTYSITDQARAYQAKKLKQPPLSTEQSNPKRNPEDRYQQENDSDDAYELVGLAASMDPYDFENYTKDHRLERLPRHKKGSPATPLLHEDKIARLSANWSIIKGFASEHDTESMGRIARLNLTEMLHRFDLFNKAYLTLLFSAPTQTVSKIREGLANLSEKALDTFLIAEKDTYRMNAADIKLLLQHPEQADRSAKMIVWLHQNDILTDSYRGKITQLTPEQMELLLTLDVTTPHIRTPERKAAAEVIFDNIEKFPEIQIVAAAKERPEYKQNRNDPTTFRVKVPELKLALALHDQLEALYCKKNESYKIYPNAQIAELTALAKSAEDLSPPLTEGQLYELIWITNRISYPVINSKDKTEYEAISKAALAAELGNHFFTKERFEIIHRYSSGVPYALWLATLLVSSDHLHHLGNKFNYFRLGWRGFSRMNDWYHKMRMPAVKVFLSFLDRGDEKHLAAVGQALTWVDRYDIATPERLAIIQQNPDGVAALVLHWDTDTIEFSDLQKAAACLFDLVTPLIVAKQVEANNNSEVKTADSEKKTPVYLESPHVFHMPISPKGTRAKRLRKQPLFHEKNALVEIDLEVKKEAKPSPVFSAEIKTVMDGELEQVKIDIMAKDKDDPLMTLIDETYTDHKIITVSADYLVFTANEEISEEPQPYNYYDYESDAEPSVKISSHEEKCETSKSNSAWLDERERCISASAAIHFWNLKTRACVLRVPVDGHDLNFKMLPGNRLAFTNKGNAFVYDLNQHVLQTVYQSPADNPVRSMKIIGEIEGRILLQTDSELILTKQKLADQIVHYAAKICEIRILDARTLLYTKVHQARGGLGTARGTVTLPPDTTVFLLQWNQEQGFHYDKKWRLPQEVHSMVVTRDNVLLFSDERDMFALDMDDLKAEPVKLWTDAEYCYGVGLSVENNIVTVRGSGTFYYRLDALKDYLMMLGRERIAQEALRNGAGKTSFFSGVEKSNEGHSQAMESAVVSAHRA